MRILSWICVGMSLVVVACADGPTETLEDQLAARQRWFDPEATCGDSSPRWLPTARASDTLSVAGLDRSDQEWAWLARQVPGGWAGGPFYLSSAATRPTILLRDPARKADALAALDTLLPPAPRDRPPPNMIDAKPARWDLAELYDWKHYIESNFGTARGTGINGWGIMNQRNGVLLMIESATTLPVLTEWLRGLGVPCRLVLVEVSGPISALSVEAGR